MKGFIAFFAVLALASAATISELPIAKTSIVGPSGSIVEEKNAPLIKEEIPLVKTLEPVELPVVKTIEPVEVPLVKTVQPVEVPLVKTVEHVEVPLVKTLEPAIFNSEIPLVKTFRPLFTAPLIKTLPLETVAPVPAVLPTGPIAPVIPSFYNYDYRTYPYYIPNYFL